MSGCYLRVDVADVDDPAVFEGLLLADDLVQRGVQQHRDFEGGRREQVESVRQVEFVSRGVRSFRIRVRLDFLAEARLQQEPGRYGNA